MTASPAPYCYTTKPHIDGNNKQIKLVAVPEPDQLLCPFPTRREP